jgi:hypothetical protein
MGGLTMSKPIIGPYQINDQDLATHPTLDPIDLGEWYLIINGSMVFFENEQRATEMRDSLRSIDV